MTNEELTVLAGLANKLVEYKNLVLELEEENKYLNQKVNDFSSLNKNIDKEYSCLSDECNRLRESEANALNAAEEAKRDRDEARKKLFAWCEFLGNKMFYPLNDAKDKKDLRLVVKSILAKAKKFHDDNHIEFLEGGMAK